MSESGESMSKESLPPLLETAKSKPQEVENPLLKEPIVETLQIPEGMIAQPEISQVLENRAEEIVAENEIEGKISDGSLSFRRGLRRRLTSVLATGLVALGLHAYDVFAEDKAPKFELKPAQIEAVEKVTGKPFTELKEKFYIEIPVEPDASGKYVIHIGQTHEHPGTFIEKGATHDIVIGKQKGIEDLAVGIIKTNDLECIFSEGYSDEKVAVENRDAIREWQDALTRELEKPIQIYEDVNGAWKLLSNYKGGNKFANAYLGIKYKQAERKSY